MADGVRGDSQGGMVLGPFRMSFTVKRPTFRDRVWFVVDHWRGTPIVVLWALLFRRATGIRIFGEDYDGTVFLNHGYAMRRRHP